MVVSERWDPRADVSLYAGDTLELLAGMPEACAQLVITSPPYNLGKAYERPRAARRDDYLADAAPGHRRVRAHAPSRRQYLLAGRQPRPRRRDRAARRRSSIRSSPRTPSCGCGTAIVWHFEHGLHCAQALLGTLRGDPLVHQGRRLPLRPRPDPRAAEVSGQARVEGAARRRVHRQSRSARIRATSGSFPNVKANHVEKTIHPCQFPVELVERFVLATTAPGDLVVDPYMGVGTTACAAVLHGRRAAGAELVPEYVRDRARAARRSPARGALKTRPMGAAGARTESRLAPRPARRCAAARPRHGAATGTSPSRAGASPERRRVARRSDPDLTRARRRERAQDEHHDGQPEDVRPDRRRRHEPVEPSERARRRAGRRTSRAW